jgi:hypothetical protein
MNTAVELVAVFGSAVGGAWLGHLLASRAQRDEAATDALIALHDAFQTGAIGRGYFLAKNPGSQWMIKKYALLTGDEEILQAAAVVLYEALRLRGMGASTMGDAVAQAPLIDVTNALEELVADRVDQRLDRPFRETGIRSIFGGIRHLASLAIAKTRGVLTRFRAWRRSWGTTDARTHADNARCP